jgi:predicted aconitase with swiveling domain
MILRGRLTTPLGLLAIGGLIAGCGSTHRTPAPAKPVTASTTSATQPAPARVSFLAPAPGASVGSTVRARVKLTGTGRLQFILDRGSPLIASGTALTLRHLTPGTHQLVAQLLPAGQGSAVSATVHFRVRAPAANRPRATPAPASSMPAQTSTATAAPAPAATVTPQAPAPATTQAAPPPPPATHTAPATTPAPAATTPTTATRPPAASGIPQGGGGDGDADNNGAPSDGDGNV